MVCYTWNRSCRNRKYIFKWCKRRQFIWFTYISFMQVYFRNNKKSIYKWYTNRYEEIYSLKGKINFSYSLKRYSFNNRRAFCEFDKFNDDIIHNQIIKAMLYID